MKIRYRGKELIKIKVGTFILVKRNSRQSWKAEEHEQTWRTELAQMASL